MIYLIRSIDVDCRIEAEYHLVAINSLLYFFGKASRLKGSLSLVWMVNHKHAIENNSQREDIGLDIRFLTVHHFGCHISHFAANCTCYIISGDIVVVADKHTAVTRIDKEVAVVEIFIAKTTEVETTECVNNAKSGPNLCLTTAETSFGMQRHSEEFAKLIVAIGTQVHYISIAVELSYSKFFGPEEVFGRSHTAH